jgi:hypothetical protein
MKEHDCRTPWHGSSDTTRTGAVRRPARIRQEKLHALHARGAL